MHLAATDRQHVAVQLDRFIPSRSAMDLDLAHFNLLSENEAPANSNLDVLSPQKVSIASCSLLHRLRNIAAFDLALCVLTGAFPSDSTVRQKAVPCVDELIGSLSTAGGVQEAIG